jgi:hypothetical protein
MMVMGWTLAAICLKEEKKFETFFKRFLFLLKGGKGVRESFPSGFVSLFASSFALSGSPKKRAGWKNSRGRKRQQTAGSRRVKKGKRRRQKKKKKNGPNETKKGPLVPRKGPPS